MSYSQTPLLTVDSDITAATAQPGTFKRFLKKYRILIGEGLITPLLTSIPYAFIMTAFDNAVFADMFSFTAILLFAGLHALTQLFTALIFSRSGFYDKSQPADNRMLNLKLGMAVLTLTSLLIALIAKYAGSEDPPVYEGAFTNIPSFSTGDLMMTLGAVGITLTIAGIYLAINYFLHRQNKVENKNEIELKDFASVEMREMPVVSNDNEYEHEEKNTNVLHLKDSGNVLKMPDTVINTSQKHIYK